MPYPNVTFSSLTVVSDLQLVLRLQVNKGGLSEAGHTSSSYSATLLASLLSVDYCLVLPVRNTQEYRDTFIPFLWPPLIVEPEEYELDKYSFHL